MGTAAEPWVSELDRLIDEVQTDDRGHHPGPVGGVVDAVAAADLSSGVWVDDRSRPSTTEDDVSGEGLFPLVVADGPTVDLGDGLVLRRACPQHHPAAVWTTLPLFDLLARAYTAVGMADDEQVGVLVVVAETPRASLDGLRVCAAAVSSPSGAVTTAVTAVDDGAAVWLDDEVLPAAAQDDLVASVGSVCVGGITVVSGSPDSFVSNDVVELLLNHPLASVADHVEDSERIDMLLVAAADILDVLSGAALQGRRSAIAEVSTEALQRLTAAFAGLGTSLRHDPEVFHSGLLRRAERFGWWHRSVVSDTPSNGAERIAAHQIGGLIEVFCAALPEELGDRAAVLMHGRSDR